jgi:tRNA threonylcarbamoyladenosine biosynthesis protein TsaB
VKILAFDTATRATAVALVDFSPGVDGGSGTIVAVDARDDPPLGERPRHTTRLMALIVDVLERSGSGWEDVARIAVGVGPGTFTGLRVGVATARSLARSRDIPLVGISTLQSLALGAVAPGGKTTRHEVVLAVLDARRGEVFVGAWPTLDFATALPAPLLAPQAMAPEALARARAEIGGDVLMIGGGALAFRRVLERSGTWIPEDDSPLHRVSAVNHARLAGSRSPAPPGDVQPQYLRAPDAELALRGAGSR